MEFSFKRLLARGPEIIEAERVFIKEIPLQEFGLTFIYVLLASLWCVFSEGAAILILPGWQGASLRARRS